MLEVIAFAYMTTLSIFARGKEENATKVRDKVVIPLDSSSNQKRNSYAVFDE